MIDPIHEPNLIAEIKNLSKRITNLERAGRGYTAGEGAGVHTHGTPDDIRLDGFWMNTAWTAYREVYVGSVFVQAPTLSVALLWDTGFVTGSSLGVDVRVTAFNAVTFQTATVLDQAGPPFGIGAQIDMTQHFGPKMGDSYYIAVSLRVPNATGGTFRWRPQPFRWFT